MKMDNGLKAENIISASNNTGCNISFNRMGRIFQNKLAGNCPLMRKPAWVFDARSIISPDDVIKSNLNFWRIGDGLNY